MLKFFTWSICVPWCCSNNSKAMVLGDLFRAEVPETFINILYFLVNFHHTYHIIYSIYYYIVSSLCIFSLNAQNHIVSLKYKNCFHSPYINTSSLIKKVYPNPQLSKHFLPLSTLATFIWQLGRLLCTNSLA